MFTLQEQQNMGLCGLGLVVHTTSEFDPSRMRERYKYWLNIVVDEIAGQAREEISKGFKVVEQERERIYLFKQAMNNMTPIKSANIGGTWGYNTFKSPSATKTYIKMLGTAAIGYVLPWVGLVLAVSQLFGGKKKKKMSMPWNTIFTTAVPYARQLVEQEEIARIQEEREKIKYERVVETRKQNVQAAQFKLPENVQSISKGGVIMLKPTDAPKEVRTDGKK